MRTKNEVVSLSELQQNLFVRSALNQDHVLYLAELIQNGVELPPVKVTDKRVVIDGRHRIEAYELNNRKEIKVEVVDVKDDQNLISLAYRANVGGALPPTPQDTEHTVMVLLEQGEKVKQISDLLALPIGMTRKYVANVQSKVSHAKLQRAAAAVTDGGLTVAKAAEQYGADPEKLKQVLSGHRRQSKQGLTEIQRNLTRSYRSIGIKNATMLRRLFEKYEDGDFTEKQVESILHHVEKLQRQSSRSVADWKKRFESLNGKGAEPAKSE